MQSEFPHIVHRSWFMKKKNNKNNKKKQDYVKRIVVQIARARVNTEGRRLFRPHGAKPIYSSSFSPPPPLSQAGAVYGEDANVDVAGYVSDVQCTRKRTESKDFRTPDNGVDPLKDLTEHTRKCLYDIVSCRDSGYDILADRGLEDPDGGGVIYYAEYRLDAGLNSQMEALLKDSTTVAGFRATITGATQTPSNDINGRAGFMLSGGIVAESADSGTAAGSFGENYVADAGAGALSFPVSIVAGITAGVTLVVGIPLSVYLVKAGASSEKVTAQV